MYRIDSPDSTHTLAPSTAPGPHPNSYFRKPDAIRGIKGTVLSTEWMNMVQEELAHIVEKARLKLDKADRTQLAKAIHLVAARPGDLIFQTHTHRPEGCLPCIGAAVSRKTYSDLFAKIGVSWGAGDGSTTFHTPDYRGMFLRCWDEGKGLDPGRPFPSYQGGLVADHMHILLNGYTSASKDAPFANGRFRPGNAGFVVGEEGGGNVRAGHGLGVGAETRPINATFMVYIKY